MGKQIMKCRQLFIAAACTFLIFSVIVTSISAESGNCGPEVDWHLSNGVLTITGQGDMDDYNTENLAPWYNQRNLIVSIVVEDGITAIGDAAFYDCKELRRTYFSDSLEDIGDSAFLDCINLEHIEFGDGLKSIGHSSFMLCESLTVVDFNDGLQSIGNQAFMGCRSLVSVVIPSSVTAMGNSVFAYCENLVQAAVQSSISTLPDWTFYGCSELSTVSLSDTVSNVGASSFYSCDSLNQVYSNSSADVAGVISKQIQNDVSSFEGVISSDYVADDLVVLPGEGNNITTNLNTNNSNISSSISVGEDRIDYEIDASVKTTEGWNEVIDTIDKIVSSKNTDSVTVNIELNKELDVNKDIFKKYIGENITIVLCKDGSEFVVDTSNLTEDIRINDLSLEYELKPLEKKTEQMFEVLGDATGYSLKFEDACEYRIKVKLYVGIEYARNYASLFELNNSQWNLIHSVQVDRDGYAAFYLAGFDQITKYMVGLNVEGVNITNAYIPSELNGDYNYLMDENGNMYEVTGIQSKWGITLNQFSLIVFGALGGVIVLVGLVMFIIFKMQQNKEKIRREVMNESKSNK